MVCGEHGKKTLRNASKEMERWPGGSVTGNDGEEDTGCCIMAYFQKFSTISFDCREHQ
jgi:hypothetical protein